MPTADAVFIGVDLGGTNIEAAAVRSGEVLARKKKKTRPERGVDTVIGRIEEAVRGLMEKMDATPSDFAGLCIGAPGAVELTTGIVRAAPNLDWEDVPLGSELRARLGLPVVVEAALEAEDEPMMEAVETAQFYLGLLTANLVNVLDPQVIVFGGGLVERLGRSFVEPVARTARPYYLQQQDAERIRILPSALGDDAGPVGAAVVAYRRLTHYARSWH